MLKNGSLWMNSDPVNFEVWQDDVIDYVTADSYYVTDGRVVFQTGNKTVFTCPIEDITWILQVHYEA